MNTVQLSAEKREQSKKYATKALRKTGQIPAVVYGNKIESFSVSVVEKEFRKVYRQGLRNSIIELQVNGESTNVIVYDIQRDTFTQAVTHIDFKVVTGEEPIKVKVALILEGVPYGVKTEGGKLFQPTKAITIAVDPKNDIPESITVDTTEYKAGHTYYVRDLDFGGASLASSDRAVLFSISTKGGKGDEDEEETVATPAATEEAAAE